MVQWNAYGEDENMGTSGDNRDRCPWAKEDFRGTITIKTKSEKTRLKEHRTRRFVLGVTLLKVETTNDGILRKSVSVYRVSVSPTNTV